VQLITVSLTICAMVSMRKDRGAGQTAREINCICDAMSQYRYQHTQTPNASAVTADSRCPSWDTVGTPPIGQSVKKALLSITFATGHAPSVENPGAGVPSGTAWRSAGEHAALSATRRHRWARKCAKRDHSQSIADGTAIPPRQRYSPTLQAFPGPT
jgi:hypothetical protein